MTCEEGCGGLRLVQAVELRADLVSGGLVELVKDVPSELPGLASGVGIVDGAVDGAEVGKGAGFRVAIAEPPEQFKGPLVAGDGLRMVAAVVVDVTASPRASVGNWRP